MFREKHTVECADKTGEKAISDEVVRGVLSEFEEICAIPHGSGEENALARHINDRFLRRGYKSQIDDAGNVICDIPAAVGYENVPLIMLQGHLDMVCAVREGSAFNPHRDPIHLHIDRDEETDRIILHSDGDSSLGADCGIGDAAVLWAAEDGKLRHGPIRIVFTAKEEVGLVGAKGLDESVLDDVKYVINVDGFGCGKFVAGSAGGRRETYSRYLRKVKLREIAADKRNLENCSESEVAELYKAFEICLSDFHGGHSGYDINKGRANVIKLLIQLLEVMREKNVEFYISSVSGGIKHNVIPSHASMIMVISRDDLQACQKCMAGLMTELDFQFSHTDSRGVFKYNEIHLPEYVLTEKSQNAVIDFISGIFNGVYRHMTDLPGVVDTSCNLGRVECCAEGESENQDSEDLTKARVLIFQRSMNSHFRSELVKSRKKLAEELGFKLTGYDEYSPWVFDRENPLLKIAAESYEEVTGKKADISAVHVGLEPSAFAEKKSSLCMINMGADVVDPHTIFERVYVDSIKPFALTLRKIIRSIAENES